MRPVHELSRHGVNLVLPYVPFIVCCGDTSYGAVHLMKVVVCCRRFLQGVGVIRKALARWSAHSRTDLVWSLRVGLFAPYYFSLGTITKRLLNSKAWYLLARLALHVFALCFAKQLALTLYRVLRL